MTRSFVPYGGKMQGKAYIDGGARGNPGPAGAGAIVLGPQPIRISKYIGNTTNNIAEYTALNLMLKEALEKGYRQLDIYTDSELLARQIKGEYKVKNSQLKVLHFEALTYLQKLEKFTINHIYREYNIEADRLVNEAIDHGAP